MRPEKRRQGRRIRVSRRRWRRAVESLMSLAQAAEGARKTHKTFVARLTKPQRQVYEFTMMAAGEPSPTVHEVGRLRDE